MVLNFRVGKYLTHRDAAVFERGKNCVFSEGEAVTDI
jgi:hypothetical protein